MALMILNTKADSHDELLRLITDTLGEDQRQALYTSQWTCDYITRLTSLPLDTLIKEPIERKAEQDKIKQEAQTLAYRDYPVFIHAQECRHTLDETLQGLDEHLETLINTLPDLQKRSQTFIQQAQAIVEDRAKLTRVLEHQNVLVDLLEIPQLMDTCVWNGYYSEAMDLASHVRLLGVQYPLPVIHSLQQQVQASCDSMLVQLVSHLRRPIKLAAAMSIVGHLRRMEAFPSEAELQIVFLRSRNDFLEQRLERIRQRDTSEDVRKRSASAFECLKRYIDVMREQMFEIAKQYMSIFSSHESLALLSDYMVHLITHIRDMLKEECGFIKDTSSLASLLTQLQYCGISLGRIGLDFRHLFVDAFEQAMLHLVYQWTDEATEDVLSGIKDSSDLAPSAWMSVKLASALSWQETQEKRHAHQPPMLLMDYPLLAVFTNNILSTLNALRLLPAVSLLDPIRRHLEKCFLRIGHALEEYADQAAPKYVEGKIFLQSFSSAYVRWCIPFLRGCLRQGIYGEFSCGTFPEDEALEKLLANYLPDVVVKVEESDHKGMGGSDTDHESVKDDTTSANGVDITTVTKDNTTESTKDNTTESTKDNTTESTKDNTTESTKDNTTESTKDITTESTKDNTTDITTDNKHTANSIPP